MNNLYSLDEAISYLNGNYDNSIPELDYSFLVEMDRLNLSIEDLEAYNETVADMVPGTKTAKDIVKNYSDIKELKNQWLKVASKFTMHKWIYRYIKDDKQEAMLHKYYDILVDCDNDASGKEYTNYKKAYRFICSFFGIPQDGTVIEWIEFNNNSEDKEQKQIAIRYSRGLAKIHIPEGVQLFHSSPANNIKELVPSFKSKTKGKFLYPKKRIYFTVQKQINPFKYGMGDNKFIPISKTKLSKYTPKDIITEVYIDPTYALFGDRSVYVDTDKPIEVLNITGLKSNMFGKVNLDKVKESSIEYTYDDIIVENNIREILQEFNIKNKDNDNDIKELMKQWKTSNQNHSIKTFKNTSLTEEEYEYLMDLYNTIRHEEDYTIYKKAFDKLCKFCHIVPNGTIITKLEIHSGKKEDTNSIIVNYTENTKKIRLPDGIKLYHLSKVAGIKELTPVFRGKSATSYIYDKPRVYFTIHKAMPKFLADYSPTEKVHKYECKENIKDVYVDPLVWNGKIQGAVYVESYKNIPVEEMGIKK